MVVLVINRCNGTKMRLLESLLARKEPLDDYEEALKKKLIIECLSN